MVEGVPRNQVVVVFRQLKKFRPRIVVVCDDTCVPWHTQVIVNDFGHGRIDLHDFNFTLPVLSFDEARHRIASAPNEQ